MANLLNSDDYLMYLRKSRADNPDESVEEVLAKHEEILQEFSLKHLGHTIPENCIFREVVSGETIEERPAMLEVISKLESPYIRGVIVVDPQRLSRGDLEDCGKLVNLLRYSNTEVITPPMTYNLANKMERKFFEQELMRGNDFLEYTKEILLRGRIAAVKRGCFIASKPPFGYDRHKIGDEHTLKPNENAIYVKMIFEWYAEGIQPHIICHKLDEMGVKPPMGDNWNKGTVRAILKNIHYTGKVRFNYIKRHKVIEYGHVTKKRSRSPQEEVIVTNGLHKAIISEELFDRVQKAIGTHPRNDSWKSPLKNPLAGIIHCKKCGRVMVQHPYKYAETRIECKSVLNCSSRSVKLNELVESVIFALESSELPKLEAKLKNGDGNALAIQQKHLDKLMAELQELNKKEEKQFDLLESGTYSEEIFTKRHNVLILQRENLKAAISETKNNLPKEINYQEKIVHLQEAIEVLKDDSVSIETKNQLLKTIVKRIDFNYEKYLSRGKHQYSLDIFLRL